VEVGVTCQAVAEVAQAVDRCLPGTDGGNSGQNVPTDAGCLMGADATPTLHFDVEGGWTE
jgi:hypothetical protein